MTLREKRHREVTNTLSRTVAQRDACLANLVRYEGRIKFLRKQARYLERAIELSAVKPETKPTPAPAAAPERSEPEWKETLAAVKPLAPEILKEYRETADEPGIPTFLKRTAKDAEAAAAVKLEQEERQKAKAHGRIAKMKAAASGETRKMPLTGRAALDAIRGG